MENKYEYSGKSSIFDPILDNLIDKDNGFFGPTSLQDYLRNYGFPKVIAPVVISIDSFERLHFSLKNNSAMVFRLGQSTGTGTQFAIVKVKNRLNDFFILEDGIFCNEGVYYQPEVNVSQLLAYKLLPKLTENSLVHLGFSSGLISYALGIDEETPIYPPATCNSTFSFNIKPHSLVDNEFIHNRGQVEIDSMFIERRNGLLTLFIIEAKTGNSNRSLAKHKLIYPMLSIAPQVPDKISIVPVYIKVLDKNDGIHFHVVECHFPDPRIKVGSFDELTVNKYSHLILAKSLFDNIW